MDDEVATHNYHVELEMKLNALFTSETVEIQIAKVMNQIYPTSRTETEAYRAVAGHLRTTFDRVMLGVVVKDEGGQSQMKQTNALLAAVDRELVGELSRHAISEMKKRHDILFFTDLVKDALQVLSLSTRAADEEHGPEMKDMLAALLEYIAAEILELSGGAAKQLSTAPGATEHGEADPNQIHVSAKHVNLAIRSDSELRPLLFGKQETTITRAALIAARAPARALAPAAAAAASEPLEGRRPTTNSFVLRMKSEVNRRCFEASGELLGEVGSAYWRGKEMFVKSMEYEDQKHEFYKSWRSDNQQAFEDFPETLEEARTDPRWFEADLTYSHWNGASRDGITVCLSELITTKEQPTEIRWSNGKGGMMGFDDFLRLFGCTATITENIHEDYFDPGPARFNRDFIDRAARALFVAEDQEYGCSMEHEITVESGTIFDPSCLHFDVIRDWSSEWSSGYAISRYTDFVVNVSYHGKGRTDCLEDWDPCDGSRELFHLVRFDETPGWVFAAASCIARWWRRPRALHRLRQLKAWKQVLLGTLMTEQRKSSPHLWKLNGHSGLFKKIVASFVGGETEPGLGPAL